MPDMSLSARQLAAAFLDAFVLRRFDLGWAIACALASPMAGLPLAVTLCAVAGVLLPALVWLVWAPTSAASAPVSTLVAAQLICTGLALATLLYRRWYSPLKKLQLQAQQLTASQMDLPALWAEPNELASLSQQLTLAREHILDLRDELDFKTAELKCLATHDLLTGLPSRRLLPHLFAQQAALARRHGDSLALIVVSLNAAGTAAIWRDAGTRDEALRDTAQVLQNTLRDTDMLYRTGDAEFVALLPRVNQWQQVASACERCVKALCGQSAAHGAQLGIAMFPADATDLTALQRLAGLAAGHASGATGGYRFFQPDMDIQFSPYQTMSGDVPEPAASRAGPLATFAELA